MIESLRHLDFTRFKVFRTDEGFTNKGTSGVSSLLICDYELPDISHKMAIDDQDQPDAILEHFNKKGWKTVRAPGINLLLFIHTFLNIQQFIILNASLHSRKNDFVCSIFNLLPTNTESFLFLKKVRQITKAFLNKIWCYYVQPFEDPCSKVQPLGWTLRW